jgi:hypothetical protein
MLLVLDRLDHTGYWGILMRSTIDEEIARLEGEKTKLVHKDAGKGGEVTWDIWLRLHCVVLHEQQIPL